MPRNAPRDAEWEDVGATGEEKEIMGMCVYNGKMYVGTLPSANVYRFDGDHDWSLSACVDDTPDVIYRRAWCMDVYNGGLYVGTLPSGKVHSLQTGAVVTHDHELREGWRHVAAVRTADGRLKIYIDGVLAAESALGTATGIDLSGAAATALRVGGGPQGDFSGAVREFSLEVGVAIDGVELARRAVAAAAL